MALILELDAGSEPIAGRVNADGCEPAEFVAYMQLIALLEKQRKGGRTARRMSGSIKGGCRGH